MVIGFILKAQCLFAQEPLHYPSTDEWDYYKLEIDLLNGLSINKPICPNSCTLKTVIHKNNSDSLVLLKGFVFQDSLLQKQIHIAVSEKTANNPYDTFIYDNKKNLCYKIEFQNYSLSCNCFLDSVVTQFFRNSKTYKLLVSKKLYYRAILLPPNVQTREYELTNIKDEFHYFYDSAQYINKSVLHFIFFEKTRIDSVLYKYKNSCLVSMYFYRRGSASYTHKIGIKYKKNTDFLIEKKVYAKQGKLEQRLHYYYNKKSFLQKIKLCYLSKNSYRHENYKNIRSWHFTWDDKGRIASRIVKNRWGKCLEKTTYEYVD